MMTRSADEDILAVFRTHYETEVQKGRCESLSGLGSTVGATACLRALLPAVLRALDVLVMLDAPCGDLNWMRPADLPLERYIGVDIVPGLVERARRVAAGHGDFHVENDPKLSEPYRDKSMTVWELDQASMGSSGA